MRRHLGHSERQSGRRRGTVRDAQHTCNLMRIASADRPIYRHSKYQHRYDHIVYKQRWGIEGFFAKLKQWRSVATRYDKLVTNFLGFVKLAWIMLSLK